MLGPQLRTQDEPAYCGLSSLVMVLNALAVDPGIYSLSFCMKAISITRPLAVANYSPTESN